jgi:hypothetical protein
MESHVEIIDGVEVLVKVYKTRPLPKKLTVKKKPSRLGRLKKQKKLYKDKI